MCPSRLQRVFRYIISLVGRQIFAISMIMSVAFGQQGSSEGAIRIGPGVTPPKPVRRPEPTYSPEARSAGVQGTVLLEVVIDQQGLPTDIRILSPLGYGLDERAQEAINKWRFQPALKNGSPVKILANIEVNFRLIGANFDAELEKRRTQFNRAVNLLKGDSKQAESAVKIFQELAEKKFPAAMYAYAQFLAEGKGIPADPAKSRDLIERAAQAKYGPAMFALAMTYIETKDASRSSQEIRDMIHTAAVLGSAPAQYFMGSAYQYGNPTLSFRQDEESARQFYRLCAAAGQMACQFRLGDLLLNRPNAQERDVVQGMAWLELSAGQGDAEAKTLADRVRPSLTEEQMKRITTLAQQLVHRN